MLDFSTAAPLLQAAGIPEAASEQLDLERLADELGRSVDAVQYEWEQLESSGLVLSADAELPVQLTRAGRQYLAAGGDVGGAVLDFLPHTIDDLAARRALLDAGTVVVDEYRIALLNGTGLEHARELVPPGFSEAITDKTAIDLFAAAVALMARLSDGEPAGCVAEEIIAVALIEEASAMIELQQQAGQLAKEEADAAAEELRGLFELFQDDDVLNLFDMYEPADAAVQSHSDVNQQLGVVDQRIEAWFKPFGWTSPTGYLNASNGEGE